MPKWIGLLLWMLLMSAGNLWATTVTKPSVRYTISNQTDQRIIALIQVESDNQHFSIIDTVGVITNYTEGLVIFQSHRPTLKPYQKLIIQTDRQQYQTRPLAFGDRCTAYSIKVTQTGLIVQDDYSFILRRWAIEILIVVLFTFIIKGVPLLLVATSQFNRIYTPFLVLNSFFSICILSLHRFPFDRFVQDGPIELNYIYLALLVISLAECLWYYKSVNGTGNKTRVLLAAASSSLLWGFTGYLTTLLFSFLFAHC